MPCTKQYARKYVNRNAPPYPGNQCREGQRKLGNDGQWYVVSKPNVNGVKRWIKERNRIAPVKRAPARRAPARAPRAPARRAPARAPRRAPARRSANWDIPLENVPWRMHSRLDGGLVLEERVYLTKPPGNFILYEVMEEQFVQLTDQGDPDEFLGDRLDIQDAQRLIGQGYKVWVVSESPVYYNT